jgi:outer membrane lipoprotein-sorting protein
MRLFFVLVLTFATTPLFAQSALEIVRKADELMRGESSESVITMTIQRPTWSRSVTMKGWSKGTDYSMILVQAPARDKGTVFLKRRNEIWNWVPGIARTVKMPPSMMSQSWMGSDFSNDDLVRESSIVNDYTHTLRGDSTIAGLPVHRIELIPKPDAPVVWGKVVTFITKTGTMQLLTRFYDEDGVLVTLMQASDIRTFDGRRLPARMEMVPLDKPGHKTILQYESIKFGVRLSDDFFSVQTMRRVE